MNYSSLFLSTESIENAFKPKQQKIAERLQIKPKPTNQPKLQNNVGRGKWVRAKKDITEDKCEKCDYKTTNYNYNMYKHKRRAHSDIKHKCADCNYSHTYPTRVRTHYRQVHLGVPRGRMKQVCRKDICKDVGKSDCKELKHFLLSCGQCNYSTNRNDSLKTHTRTVHEGLVESCDQCDYTTNLKSSLKRHISRKHIEETMQKRYTCDYEGCTYKTLYKYDLKNHIETKHEGIVRFRCEFMNCNFGANDPKSLREHTEIHNEKAYKCHLCDTKFARKQSMRNHIKNIHEGPVQKEKAYKCHLCDTKFAWKRSIRKHIKNIHEGALHLKCDIIDCAYETYDKRLLEAHLRNKHSTEEPRSENCKTDKNLTVGKPHIIKSKVFGEITEQGFVDPSPFFELTKPLFCIVIFP